jgi:hypothetical protein
VLPGTVSDLPPTGRRARTILPKGELVSLYISYAPLAQDRTLWYLSASRELLQYIRELILSSQPACYHHIVTENSQGTKGEKDIHSHSTLLELLTCIQYPTRAYHCVEHFRLCLLTLAIQVKTWTLLYMDPGMAEAALKLLPVHRSLHMSEAILSNHLTIHTQSQGL